MLLGNHSLLCKHPGRDLGGALQSIVPGATLKPTQRFGQYFGTVGSAAYKLASMPPAYGPPYCFSMPRKAGAIGCNTLCVGTSTDTGSIAGGRNVTGQSNGAATGAGDAILIGWIVALSAGSSTDAGAINAVVSGSGTSDGSSTDTGAITGGASLGGSSDGTSYATGLIAGAMWAAGTSAGSSDATGYGTMAANFTGASAGASTDAGAITGAWFASGESLGAATASGIVMGLAWLSGDALGTSVDAATLTAQGWISGESTPFTALSPESLAASVWAATVEANHVDGTMGGLLYAAGGGSDPSTVAAAVWSALESAAPGTMGAALTLLRKLGTNKLVEAAGNPGTATLYDDDGVTPIATWALTDATGGAVTDTTGSPARRVPT